MVLWLKQINHLIINNKNLFNEKTIFGLTHSRCEVWIEEDNGKCKKRLIVLSATNAELEFEKKIEKNEADGRHLYLTIDASNIKTNYKMYFKNGIFYKLAVVTEEGKLFNKTIGEFFDSFEMVE